MSKMSKIFGGMKGSNDPRYRTASTLSMICGPASSGSKMVFYILMSMTSYAANQGFGVAVAVTGILLQIKSIMDGTTDPIFALIYDRMKVGKHGKIRKFVLAGWLLESLSCLLMFNLLTGKFEGAAGIGIFVVLYFLFVIGYTMHGIGGASIPIILTNDPKQRPFMNLMQMVYSYAGPLLSSNIINLLVLPRYNNQFNLPMLKEACFWYIGLSGFFLILCFIGISSVDNDEVLGELMRSSNGEKRIGIKDMGRMLRDNVPLRCYVVAGATDKIANNTATQQVMMTLLNGILIGSYQAANTVNNMSMLIGFIFAFFGGVYIAKKGVKTATTVWSAASIAITIFMAVMMIILGPVGMQKVGKPGALMMLYMAMMMGKSATTMILNVAEGMMRADVCDYELERSGNYMPGSVGAIYSFIDKIVASFGSTIASFAVAAIGYKSVMPQQGDTPTWRIILIVELICYGMPIIGWICNIIAMHFYELSKERMVEVQTNIAERKKAAKAAMAKN